MWAPDLDLQTKVPAQTRQPEIVLALLHKQVHAAAHPPKVQHVSDIQTEQHFENTSTWHFGQLYNGAPELHGVLCHSKGCCGGCIVRMPGERVEVTMSTSV